MPLMKYCKMMYCFILMLMCDVTVSAQYFFRHLEREQGLSHLSITSCLQDRRGFMWFGTKLGLNVYDGERIKKFYPDENNENSLPDAYVTAITESPNGDIWIGTSKGVCAYHYDNGSFAYLKNLDVPVSTHIFDLKFDKFQQLWIISGDMFCYNISQKSIKQYNVDFSPWKSLITPTNELIVVSFSGELYKYSLQEDTFVKICRIYPENKYVRPTALINWKGKILVSTTGAGLCEYDPILHKVHNIRTLDKNGKMLHVHNIMKRRNGDLWLGTEHGIYIITQSAMTAAQTVGKLRMIHLEHDTNNINSVSDNAVHVLCEDRENGVWVGTYFGGMNYYPSSLRDFKVIEPRMSNSRRPIGIVREIIPDGARNLYVATETNGLFKYSLNSSGLNAISLKFENHAITSNIHTLLLSGRELWIGTFDEGIYIYNLDNRKIIKHFYDFAPIDIFNANAIVKLFQVDDGNILIGTMAGLYLYDKKTEVFSIIDDSSYLFVHWIYQSRDGEIWIASLHHGLFKLKKSENGYSLDNQHIDYSDITTIYEDSKHNFWIGTNTHGLRLYDRQSNKFKECNLNVCETNKVIGKIVEDANACLWISTSDGLYCYDLNTKEEMRYGVHNSLPTDQFNVNSGFLASDGKMYFGSMKGLIKFDPYKQNRHKKTFKVYFTDLVTSESSFSVNFTVPLYSSVQSLWYRYKLEGVDDDWIVAQGAQNIKYSNLTPGTYNLIVEASTINGLWLNDYNKCSSLQINIQYPILLSPLAITIYIIIFIIIAYFLISTYRKRVLADRQRKIEKIRNEIDKETLNDKIRFFTDITHEIRTPLTLIIGCLERISKSKYDENIKVMRQNVDRLHNLVNQLLDFRKIEVSSYALDMKLIDIKEMVSNVSTTFLSLIQQKEVKFHLNLCKEDCIAMADPEAVTKITSNMLSNAIKYCVNEIYLYISVRDDSFIEIKVNNDGEHIAHEEIRNVFKPFKQIYRNDANVTINGTGLGLPLAKKMAELQNGTFIYDEECSLNSFVLTLPAYKRDNSDNENQVDDLSPTQSSLGNLLLVDDEKQLRAFVAEELSETYTIIQSENGEKAFELLESHNIDLVITDIMMPVMDGIELCRKIKEDIRFCHIPVIMLTAKVSLEDHIEALNSKSDAYIEKPFYTSELMAQIDNLLANRRLLCSSYVKSPYALTENIVSNDIDKAFLDDLSDFILKSMSEPDFSVEMLSEHANMSMSTLYRKIKGLTSLSPNEFIKYCKLKKAAELIAEGKTTIKSIAEFTGFSSVSYFTSCFTKQFGVSPGKFVMNKK